MGNFQAITIEKDELVEFTGDAINVITAPTEIKAFTIDKYYKSILKAALTTFQPKNELLSVKEKIDAKDEAIMKKLWGEISTDSLLIGYILKDAHLSKDIDTLLDRIADEENKYYWKWIESNNEVQEVDDNNKEIQIILNKLRIVNARLLNRIFINPPQNSTINNQNLWIDREKPIQDDTLIVPAIAIIPLYYTTNDGKFDYNYYGVYVNTNARLLFLDDSEDTQKFKYGKKNDTVYEKKLTYIYDKNVTDKIVHKNNENADYFWGDKYIDIRYWSKLKNQINILWSKNQGKGFVTKIVGDIFELKEKQTDLINKIDFKTTDRNKTERERAQNLAKTKAYELPTGNYHCFYYDNGGNLMGHISRVSIGEGGRGGSGYPMRADKVNEVNYQWSINLPVGNDNIPLAKLWSYLFGLDQGFLATNSPTIKTNRTTNTDKTFYPTNWYYNKESPKFTTKTDTDADSLINYYKTFNDSQTRRNKPNSNPFPPRVTNPEIVDYDYKFDIKGVKASVTVKLDNTSYRLQKKFNTNGSDLTLGLNENERKDAGTTMAEALSDFDIYTGMKGSDITPKITSSKLSATSFAKYVLGPLNDNAVKTQWRSDNQLDINAPVNVSSLKTDQEWCHLFGHGDGGPEELGNFVCGSKHCNTEQLAIETGQRRVSQNETDFTSNERKKLKARITAYLIPNSGTWITGETTYTQDYLNKTLLENITNDDVKNKQKEFFENAETSDQFKLRKQDDLTAEFKKLSDEIKNAPTDTDVKKKIKEELVQFRHNLEKHFFMYLPIARWMRYKLYYDGKKVFDHIYDAQSESMNLHECQILDYTVERVLYKAMNKEAEYKQKIKERVEKLMPISEEADITVRVLDLDIKVVEILNNLNQANALVVKMSIEIGKIKDKLDKPGSDIKEINLEQLELDSKKVEVFLESTSEEIKKQEEFWNEIVKDFKKNLTEEQQSKSYLKSIILDKELPDNIKDIQTKVEDVKVEQSIITAKIDYMKLQKDSMKDDIKDIQEKTSQLSNQLKQIIPDRDSNKRKGISDPRLLKEKKMRSDNFQKVSKN